MSGGTNAGSSNKITLLNCLQINQVMFSSPVVIGVDFIVVKSRSLVKTEHPKLTNYLGRGQNDFIPLFRFGELFITGDFLA